jgi:uncharacterized protein (DUF885 family)
MLQGNDPDARLLGLLEEDLEAQMRRSPLWASSRGDRRFDALLDDLSPAAHDAFVEDARARLGKLREIDRSRLAPANRVHAGLLEHELSARIEQARFRPEESAVDQLSGPQRELPQLPETLRFTNPKQLEDYLLRLLAVGTHVDQSIANLRRGLARGFTPPRVVMGGVAGQAFVHAADELRKEPERHAMFQPFRDLAPEDPLRARARAAIVETVIPAFRALGCFLRDEYVPRCRTTIAASDLPDGRDYYASRLRRHTTTEMTAAAIHALGLSEVARIRAEMESTIARTGFRGDFAAFVEHLRTDPRFYFTAAEDLLRGYRDICKRVDAELPRLFGRLPRLPYGVREMPAFLAPASPTAYYYRGSLENGVAGYFVANTWRLDQRPKYEMVPLALHEAVPGHHLQIALAQEMEGVPEWRELLDYTVYVEGWALYAERLGLEMGLYRDPYDDFGRLSYEMWRALRLVVDTGIHANGWSRDRAIETMLANSALTRTNVEKEVDRYIAWPGQAVAYKIGELEIRALRAKAEKELGARFDPRAFHDLLLGEGALPLGVLRERVADWIRERS